MEFFAQVHWRSVILNSALTGSEVGMCLEAVSHNKSLDASCRRDAYPCTFFSNKLLLRLPKQLANLDPFLFLISYRREGDDNILDFVRTEYSKGQRVSCQHGAPGAVGVNFHRYERDAWGQLEMPRYIYVYRTIRAANGAIRTIPGGPSFGSWITYSLRETSSLKTPYCFRKSPLG
jgi:hypothetical protein